MEQRAVGSLREPGPVGRRRAAGKVEKELTGPEGVSRWALAGSGRDCEPNGRKKTSVKGCAGLAAGPRLPRASRQQRATGTKQGSVHRPVRLLAGSSCDVSQTALGLKTVGHMETKLASPKITPKTAILGSTSEDSFQCKQKDQRR